MADEALRRFVVEASRRQALESRAHYRSHSHLSLMPLAGGLLAGALLLSRRRSFVRTVIVVGACGYLAAMLTGRRRAARSMMASEQTPSEPSDAAGVDEASRLSFPASDPPALGRHNA